MLLWSRQGKQGLLLGLVPTRRLWEKTPLCIVLGYDHICMSVRSASFCGRSWCSIFCMLFLCIFDVDTAWCAVDLLKDFVKKCRCNSISGWNSAFVIVHCVLLLTTSQLCWRAIFTLMSWLSNELKNVGSLLFATNYWTSILMHGWIRIFVTRLFGDLFRLFQSCPCDYQTNGARDGYCGNINRVTIVISGTLTDSFLNHIIPTW